MNRLAQCQAEIERGEMRFVNARALIAVAVASEAIVNGVLSVDGANELTDALDVLREDVEI